MRVYLSPLESANGNKSKIKFNGERVQVNDKLYDFTDVPNGILRTKINDTTNAKRVNGDLLVEIENCLDQTATQNELYPQWQTVERNDVLDDNLTIVTLDWYSDYERESDEALASLQPSAQELADADLEIKMITLLMEMEVI